MCGFIQFKTLEEAPFADEVLEQGFQTIVNNPHSISPFRKAAEEGVEAFKQLYREAFCTSDSPYILVAFYDTEVPNPLKDKPVGAAILGVFPEWFYPKTQRLILSELCTASFKRGAGLTRRVVAFMENYAKEHNISIISGGCANDPCSTIMSNGYKKCGFKGYMSYYKEIN